MLSEALITVGLGLDILGAVLIFMFGIPPEVRRGGHSSLILEGDDPEEDTKARQFDRLSESGVLLLIVGFAFQIGGVWA
jgi:hypothetical protein